MPTFETNLAALKDPLPPVSAPKGLYRPVVRAGDLLYTSGHLPIRADGTVWTGRVGETIDEHEAKAAARQAALAILATLRAELGTLDRLRRLVRLVGLVNCTPQFTAQPAVVNGASELLAEVFGPEAGVGARTAFGAASLPLGAAVELEAIFQIADDGDL
jgi:enamine deaminase RidA (YjgF/YER057c/UK114 family)